MYRYVYVYRLIYPDALRANPPPCLFLQKVPVCVRSSGRSLPPGHMVKCMRVLPRYMGRTQQSCIERPSADTADPNPEHVTPPRLTPAGANGVTETKQSLDQ